MPSRRQFLEAVCALLPVVAGALAVGKARANEIEFGHAQSFDFDWLRSKAKALAGRPYKAPAILYPEILERIDFDAYQQIHFRPDRALWAGRRVPFTAQFFHLGRYFKVPVKLYALEQGMAREILYNTEFFEFGTTKLDRQLPSDLGFAGFRVMNPGNAATDWLAFQGASYFRSSGELDQYGISTRGLAINTGLATPEEFPYFSAFWLQYPRAGEERITIYALLESPSLSGAYRLDCNKVSAVTIDVRAELFLRNAVERLGVAPLTSMFWYAENNRHQALDWRPEIHDSDGLAIWNGDGERIWRPLNNPPTVRTNSFFTRNPKGFGLLQRDRAFHNYEDDGAFYHRRPSVWVEPLGDWGEGAVQLVEIPTNDEIHDNIVAYWLPQAAAQSGAERFFNYRLHWVGAEPYPPDTVGRVRHTRIGIGGIPGQPRPKDTVKFVIDFSGGPLRELEQRYDVTTVASASRGTIDNAVALKVVGTPRWRASFDLFSEGGEPVDLRCYLRLGDRTLTETWLYQYVSGYE